MGIYLLISVWMLSGILLIIAQIKSFRKAAINTFKVAYYEQKLKNHYSKFERDQWRNIESVMEIDSYKKLKEKLEEQ